MISMVSGNNEKCMVTNELDDDSIEYLNVHQKKYGIWGVWTGCILVIKRIGAWYVSIIAAAYVA